jgi:uncharacterized repeat protein (TIGR01451 family)
LTGTLPDPLGGGALRLTTNQQNQTAYAIYTAPITTANGLDVTFDYHSYGGDGADGLSFMLLDGSTDVTAPGGFGGSLGYAPMVRDGQSKAGIAGGYLAVGLDEFGNFVNSYESRDTGCPTSRYDFLPNAVTVRGAAGVSGTLSMMPSYEGYCFLATSGTLTQTLDNPNSTRTSATLRRVHITLSPQRQLWVEIDFGSGYAPIIGPLNLASVLGQPPMPSTVKLGFAASTGARRNYHEVRNLVVRADRTGVRATKTHTTDFINEQTGSYKIDVVNNGTLPSLPGAPVLVTDTLPAGLTYSGSYSGPDWVFTGTVGAGQVTASYSPGVTDVISPRQSLPSLQFTVTVNSLTPVLTNTADVAMTFAAGVDRDTAFDITFIAAPDLTITATVQPSQTLPGRLVTFTLSVANVGTAAANNLGVTQQFPTDLTIQSVQPDSIAAWSCTSSNGVQCTAPTLALNTTSRIIVVGRLGGSVAGGATLTSNASVTATTQEIGSAPNSASVSLKVGSLRSLLPIIVRR